MDEKSLRKKMKNEIMEVQFLPTITEISFDEIGEGLGRLERHEIKGRLVANLEK